MTLLPVAGLVGSNNLSTAVIILGIGVLLIFVANPRSVSYTHLKPILPGKEDMEENPRSKSAKLRIFERKM